MESVGIRELNTHMSRYLKKVKAGQSLVITDRKKEVAIIMPKGMDAQEERLMDLARRGIADWSGGRPKGLDSRIVSKGEPVSRAVLEDRE